MVGVKNIKNLCKLYDTKSILQTKHIIHGINPVMTYPPTGKNFDLPRFSSVEMQMAVLMNRIATKNEYIIRSQKVLSSTKILPEDLKRLQSTTLEDSYKRAFWINPKNDKAYHLLDEGRTNDGLQKLRILDENGVFVKNAIVKPKTVILTDLKKERFIFKCWDGNNLTHLDIINIMARRYNPFAKYKYVILENEDSYCEYYNKISNLIDKDTSCVSASFCTQCHSSEPIRARGNVIRSIIETSLKQADGSLVINKGRYLLEQIANKTRFLMGAGNNGNNSYNVNILYKLEGVGGLTSDGKIHPFSSSRNSLFTEHYENFEFPITLTNEGVNITGLHGTDYPLADTAYAKAEGNLSGTSFSTPIRAAKLALNDMMEGIF